MDIFGLGRSRLDTIVNKIKSGAMIIKDKRGGKRYQKFSDDDRQMIRDHINSIPREVRHYC